MSRATTVRVTLPDAEDRSVELRVRYSPPREPYFSASFGNWLPGDPEDVEVVSARALEAGADVESVLAREDEIYELAREAAGDKEEADADDAADREREYRRDRERDDDRYASREED